VAQPLAVGLAGTSDIFPRDRRERKKLDRVDLDLAEANPVAGAFLDPWALP